MLTISDKFDDYAKKVRDEIYAAGFECDFNSDSGTTLNKKVSNAQLDNYNFIFVIEEQEKQRNTVNVRTRDNKVHGEVSIEEVIRRFKALDESKSNNAEEEFGSGDAKPTNEVSSSSDVKQSAQPTEPLDQSKYC